MKWGKFVLFFQAIVTLVFGLIFFSAIIFQSNTIKAEKANLLSVTDPGHLKQLPSVQDFEFRFKTSGYVLVVISLIEMVIISRFLD